jgi:hypothetical membrane protein
MTPELMPFIVFGTLSIFVPVMLGLVYQSRRAFRRTLMAGLLVIITMIGDPQIAIFSENLHSYTFAAVFTLFCVTIGLIIMNNTPNYTPTGIYLGIALPVALVGSLLLAILIGLHATSA